MKAIRLTNGDCAEEFELSSYATDIIEPGTVMVLNKAGNLEQSDHPDSIIQ